MRRWKVPRFRGVAIPSEDSDAEDVVVLAPQASSQSSSTSTINDHQPTTSLGADEVAETLPPASQDTQTSYFTSNSEDMLGHETSRTLRAISEAPSTNYDFGDDDLLKNPPDEKILIECETPKHLRDRRPNRHDVQDEDVEMTDVRRAPLLIPGASLKRTLEEAPTTPRKSGMAVLEDDPDNPFMVNTQPSPTKRPRQFDDYIVIAHNQVLQDLFEARRLCFGVTFEIARLITLNCITWDSLAEQTLDSLMGSNAECARKTAELVCGREDAMEVDKMFLDEIAITSPWEQLDFEKKHLPPDPFVGLKAPFPCLGFEGDGIPSSKYGGKVQFRGTLGLNEEKSMAIKLERPTLGSSCLFARRFGCENFLRIKVETSVLNRRGELQRYLRRPFILLGRVYRAFRAQGEDVFFLRTNEIFRDGEIVPITAIDGIPFLKFIEFFNSLQWNQEQTMAKWASRFALGQSNSVPGVLLEADEIFEIDDKVSPEGSDMTDGCGFVSREILRQIRHRLNLEEVPTAIQVRIRGSKGLLIEDTTSTVPGKWVRLRKSMIKVQHPSPHDLDPSLRIIDFLRYSQCKTPSRLGYEIMINLAENGVPKEAFCSLFTNGLNDLVAPLLAWDGPNANIELYKAVAKATGAYAERKARRAAGEARALGYTEKTYNEEKGEEDDADSDFGFVDKAIRMQSTRWWPDYISGSPSSLAETVMSLAASGFMPQTCAVMADKLKNIIHSTIKNFCTNYHCDVPMSCTAFLVPDPFGVLTEGEIHFKSSVRNLRSLQDDDSLTDQVLGDVLLGRSPCKLPTDVQKWKSVDCPELKNMLNVIVLSTQGSRRAADFLSGGDYDGDKGLLIWQPDLVEPFNNADPRFSLPPKDIKSANFVRENKTVSEFLEETAMLSEEDLINALQKYLLAPLGFQTAVGTYSNHHLKSIYLHGYSDERTIRLANIFCMILDGAKTGLTLLPEVMRADSRQYSLFSFPKWGLRSDKQDDGRPIARKNPNLGVFIMDVMRHEAKAVSDDIKVKMEQKWKGLRHTTGDPDLISPWKTAWKRAKDSVEAGEDRSKQSIEDGQAFTRLKAELWGTRRMKDLEKIKSHVEKIYDEHRETARKQTRARSSEERWQDESRRLSKMFSDSPSDLFMEEEEASRLKASYAYEYDYIKKSNIGDPELRWTRFPFDVAFRELCAIKARALGWSKTITYLCDENMRF